ncbi:MAG TPA: hypothetical protein VMV92_04465 [Streptosporangiaceae bacterium]|nr:hypothetical protein [Streptosporangiaceae bacterium]
MRAAFGEAALFEEVHPGRFNYPEIGIVLLGALFGEWRPGPDEIDALLCRVENTLLAAHGLAPGDYITLDSSVAIPICWSGLCIELGGGVTFTRHGNVFGSLSGGVGKHSGPWAWGCGE